MQEGISVFRIDYEIRSSEDGEQKLWSACIAAYDQEEALAYLGKFLGKTFKTLQLERRSRLDAITDPIRQKIIDVYLAEEKAKKPVGKQKETKPKEIKPRGKSIIKK